MRRLEKENATPTALLSCVILDRVASLRSATRPYKQRNPGGVSFDSSIKPIHQDRHSPFFCMVEQGLRAAFMHNCACRRARSSRRNRS